MENIHQKIVFFVILISQLACKQNYGENISAGEITKISIAFSGSGCEGLCPYRALSIDNSLHAYLYNGPGSRNNGYFQGTVTKTFWDSTRAKFQKFISRGIDTLNYEKTDQPELEFIIATRGEKKYFEINTGKINKEDLKILYTFIDQGSNINNLKQTNSLKFETTLQYKD